MTRFLTEAARRLLASGALAIFAAGVPGASAWAIDGAGFAASSGPTYYEEVVQSASPDQLNSNSSQLPTSLHFSDSSATVQYISVQTEADRIDWTLKIRGLTRNHERVDAVYQIIAVLPLPQGADGKDAFQATQWGIAPREGPEGAGVPFIYGGEKVLLKRNVALERMLLPNLVGPSGSADKLPSLAGTGYEYTLWDAIIRYDSGFGDTVQVFADLQYATDAGVSSPNAADEDLKAYVLTWIPGLDASIAPFTIRMDIQDP